MYLHKALDRPWSLGYLLLRRLACLASIPLRLSHGELLRRALAEPQRADELVRHGRLRVRGVLHRAARRHHVRLRRGARRHP